MAAAVLAAPRVAGETAKAIKQGYGFVKRASHAAAESAGLTEESGGDGRKWVGAIAALLYNDLATWWDTRFAPSLVGGALGIRGTLPRVRAKRDPSGKILGPEIGTSMDAYEAQQYLSQSEAGANAFAGAMGVATLNPVLWGAAELGQLTGWW